jgi:kynureninase
MDRLLSKQYLLTGYLEYLMDHLDPAGETGDEKFVEIITPRDPRQRGTQLSVMFPFSVKEIHEKLEKRGVVVSK